MTDPLTGPLSGAYDRLVEASEPPPDARARVASRVAQRRRRRTASVAGLAVAAVLTAGGVAAAGLGDPAPPETATDAAPSTSPAAPGATPSTSAPMPPGPLPGVTCPGGAQPRTAYTDPVLYGTLDELRRELERDLGPAVLDQPADRFVWFRADGSVHTIMEFSTGRTFGLESIEECPGGRPDVSP